MTEQYRYEALLNENNVVTDLLATMEEKTGIQRQYITSDSSNFRNGNVLYCPKHTGLEVRCNLSYLTLLGETYHLEVNVVYFTQGWVWEMPLCGTGQVLVEAFGGCVCVSEHVTLKLLTFATG